MNVRWIGLVAVMMLCVATLPVAPASGMRLSYQGAALTTHQSAEADCAGLLSQRLGIVCVDIPSGAHAMAFQVEDASKLPVGGSYYLYDASGGYVGSGTHCGAEDVSLGAATKAVIRLEAVNGPLVCASEGKTAQGLATKGVIGIVFA